MQGHDAGTFDSVCILSLVANLSFKTTQVNIKKFMGNKSVKLCHKTCIEKRIIHKQPIIHTNYYLDSHLHEMYNFLSRLMIGLNFSSFDLN